MLKKGISWVLLVTFLLSFLSGCGKKEPELSNNLSGVQAKAIYDVAPPEITGVKIEPADGIGKPGIDFTELETGPADDWADLTIPFFNPLGSLSLYENVNYEPKGSANLETLEGITRKTFSVVGEEWVLKIPSDVGYSHYWMRWYAKEMGAKQYNSTHEKATFSVMENDHTLWWVDVRAENDGAYLTVIKTNYQPIGQTLTIDPSQWSEEGYGFYTECTPGKLQSATITLKGGSNSGIDLRVDASKEWGLFEYQVSKSWYSDQINTVKTDTYIFDDIPITEGLLYWQMRSADDSNVPERITFSIDDVADIQSIHWGDTPGAIRLKGVPMGDARVFSQEWASVTHHEIDYASGERAGVNDQHGDLMFVVPSGYFQIKFPSGYYSNDSLLRLVPVSAGEITTVTIPQEMKATVGAMSRLFGDFELNEGGIEVLSNTDQTKLATTSFVLNDPLDRDVTLAKEDIVIYEDGLEAVIKSVEREPAGSNVTLVLDSSGSMRENMKPCVDAAARFVEGLPDNTTIRLIQFAQQVIEHPGEDKAAVLKALATVKEGGATSLYDATAQAIKVLKEKKRGYIVVFSDGADSREPGIDGTGSGTTKEELLEEVKNAGVTVLTIGFEKGHDPTTLIAMAKASENGAYFAATDKSMLEGVFASVAGKLGNQFTATYERPSVVTDEKGSVPVVSLMIDRSGSMDLAPEPEDDVDYRIDDIKRIFHDFVLNLPNGTLMQSGSFAEPMGGDYPRYDQITTTQKAPILQALGSLVAGGGTPTDVALRLAYQSLEPIPSSKRVLVFFTDAALKGEETEDGNVLDIILEEIRKSGIRVLFVGLANTSNAASYKNIFQSAAKKAGGDYIITDNLADIVAKLDELLKRIDQPQPRQGITFSMGIDYQFGDGSRMNVHTSKILEDFAPRSTKGVVQNPGIVTFKMGEKYITYEGKAAKLLYGGDQPAEATRILGKLQFENKAVSNTFGKLTVTEAFWMNTFKGIDAPADQYFLALHTHLDFEKSAGAQEIGYLVPNIFNHFFVSCNEGRMMPASEATWLAETPFLPPGEEGVTVDKNHSANGMLVFMIDRFDENLKQLSLHLYDTVNGHMELSLIGRLAKGLEAIDQLPKEEPAKISDAFSLTMTGLTDMVELAQVELSQISEESEEAKKNLSFRVLEGNFDSKVQALLDIDPQARFLYQLDTDQGALLSPMSDIVHHVPLGFIGSTMLAPGSHNAIRMPFVIPNELKTVQSGIFGDLQEDTLYIPVTKGAVYKTGSLGKTYSHEYFDLTIHSLSPMYMEGDKVVLDFTLADKQDGMGTGGLEGVLLLQHKEALGEADTRQGGQREPTNEELIQKAVGRKGLDSFADDEIEDTMLIVDTEATGNLLYGAYTEKGNWAAFDGQKRRGILIFKMPSEDDLDQWLLTSSLLPEMAVPISDSVYPYAPLLAPAPDIPENPWFKEALEVAVSAAITEYKATRPKPEQLKRVGLSDKEIMGEQVPSPSLTLYGTQLIASVQSEKDFFNIMNAQKWLPSQDVGNYYFAPEAVLTQGFGGEGDLYNLAKVLLTRIGYQTKHRAVRLSEVGIENLQRIGQVQEVPELLPALAYTDEAGMAKVYVPIFSRDVSELGGLCTLMSDFMNTEVGPAEGRITIELYGKLIGNAGMAATRQVMSGIGEILGGEEAAEGAYYESVTALDRAVSLPEMSLDAFDISYLATAKSEGGELILPVLDTRQGLLYDQSGWVDTSNYEFQSIKIRLEGGISSRGVVHTTILKPGQKLTEICHTLAWGVPEITGQAAASFEGMVTNEAKAAEKPANYSIARWMGHATIARLVKGMTDFGLETAQRLAVKAGRTSIPLAYMVTMQSDGQKAEAVVDLMQHRNQLHSGEEDVQHAYNMMYGAFASEMESAALPGGEGIHYLDVWRDLPNDASLVLLAPETTENYEEAVRLLTEKGYPQRLIDRMQTLAEYYDQRIVFVIPDQPAMVNGKMRWAWLEIDQETFDMVSVFETGERAGMTDYLIGFFPNNWAEVGAGAFAGITTAVWGISIYSLETDDYEEIIKNAQVLCGYIGGQIGKVTGVTGSIGQAGNLGQMSTGYGSQNDRLSDVLAKLFEMAETQWLQPSFEMGYNEAVKAYFNAAS